MSSEQDNANMLKTAAAVLRDITVDMEAVPKKPEPLVDPLLKKIGVWLGGSRLLSRVIFFVRGTNVVTVLTEALRREQQRLAALEAFEVQMYRNIGQAWKDGGSPDLPGLDAIVAKVDADEVAKEAAAIARLDERHSSLSRMLIKRQESMEGEVQRREEKLQQAVGSISIIDNAASQLALEGSLALRQVLEELPNELKRSLQRASFNEVRDDLDSLKQKLHEAIKRMQDGLTRAAKDLVTHKGEAIEEEQQIISMRSELTRRRMTRDRDIHESLGQVGQELLGRLDLFYNGKYVSEAMRDGHRLLIETRRRLEGLDRAFHLVNALTRGFVLNRQILIGVVAALGLGVLYLGVKTAVEMGVFESETGIGSLHTWELPQTVEIYGEVHPGELESFVPLIRCVNDIRKAMASQPSANMLLDSGTVLADGVVVGFAGYLSERRMITVGPFADQVEKIEKGWVDRGVKPEPRDEYGITIKRLDYLRGFYVDDDGRLIQGDPDLLGEMMATRTREVDSLEKGEGFSSLSSEITASGCAWFVVNATSDSRVVSAMLNPFGFSEMPSTIGVEIFCSIPMRTRVLLHYETGGGVQARAELSQTLSARANEGVVAQVRNATESYQVRYEGGLVVVELDLKPDAVPALLETLF